MQRALIGLYTTQPSSPSLESTTGDGINSSSVQVEDQQEWVDGTTVYAGEAAHVGHEEQEVPVIADDDSITQEPRSMETRKYCEWLAVPGTDVPFVAVDREAEFARNHLGAMTDGWIEPAVIDLHRLTPHLRDERGALLTQVTASNTDEAITVHRSDRTFDDVVARVLDEDDSSYLLSQVGFQYSMEDGSMYRGTVASSGFLALYSGAAKPAELARFITDELLPYAGVKDVGPAEDIAASWTQPTSESPNSSAGEASDG